MVVRRLVRGLCGRAPGCCGQPRPLPALLALDNVVLAPHIASGTHETRRAMADLVLHNLQQFIATGRPAAEVPWSAAQ